jgi:thiol-disulfide isomerase/thioredoxin
MVRLSRRAAALVIVGGLMSATGGAAADGKIKLQTMNWEQSRKLIAGHKGKIVVVDAWSTSCVPCMREFPNLVALQKRLGGEVACVSLNLDYSGIATKPAESYRPRVEAFLTKQQAEFDNILCSDVSDDVYEQLGIASIPAVLVYDRTGKLVKTFDNSNAKDDEEGFTYQDVNAFVDRLKRAK